MLATWSRLGHWVSMVRTGGVRSGPNRKCDQFPWLDGRSCLLTIKYKFSAEYCLPFRRSLQYISTMDSTRLWMLSMLSINKEISSSEKLQTIFAANSAATKYTDKVQHKFLPPKPKDCLKCCESGVSMVRTGCSSEPVQPWKPSECSSVKARYVLWVLIGYLHTHLIFMFSIRAPVWKKPDMTGLYMYNLQLAFHAIRETHNAYTILITRSI